MVELARRHLRNRTDVHGTVIRTLDDDGDEQGRTAIDRRPAGDVHGIVDVRSNAPRCRDHRGVVAAARDGGSARNALNSRRKISVDGGAERTRPEWTTSRP
jgi:hypothetical protein